jgi:hypothetical protein
MTKSETAPQESTATPREYPPNGEILRELYHRFANGANERYGGMLNRLVLVQVAAQDPPQFRVHKRGKVHGKECVGELYRMLKARYERAQVLWVPDELERRRAALRSQNLIERADHLKELRPDTQLIRLLFDHPDSLPSPLDSKGRDSHETVYDALVWLHFELYPSLRKSFRQAIFPAAEALPETVLGKASTHPAGTSAQPGPAEVTMAQAGDQAAPPPAGPIAPPADPGASAKYKYANQMDFDSENRGFFSNKEALADANKVGRDHDIQDLTDMGANALNKLLRSHRFQVRFMSQQCPPRGRVHKTDWKTYLAKRVSDKETFDQAVEQKASEIARP